MALRRGLESVEAESRRNWHLTRNIVDTIRDPLVVLDGDMTIVIASKAFLVAFGITQAQAHGRQIFELGQHQWNVRVFRDLMERVIPDDQPIESFEIEDDFPGLGRRVFNLNARKISQPGNHAHRLLLVFEDITDRKQRERDAEMLKNEISHRIKNNLQIIVGLIGFEAKSMPDANIVGYRAMQARIGAIAELYDLISHSKRGGAITADSYLRGIAKTMSATLLGAASNIKIEVDAEALEIDPDKAVPFGLLVNELATNAVKHAFPDGIGRVVVSVRQAGDNIALTVSDNGIGIAKKDTDTAKAPERRGFNYIAIFVRQLGGTIVASPSDGAGTTVAILLPRLGPPIAGPERVAA